MAPRKTSAQKQVTPTEANDAITFESELELSLSVAAAMAPAEMKDIINDLKNGIINLHNRYLMEAVKERDTTIDELSKDIDVMFDDINALKNTVLRMAIVQYGG